MNAKRMKTPAIIIIGRPTIRLQLSKRIKMPIMPIMTSKTVLLPERLTSESKFTTI